MESLVSVHVKNISEATPNQNISDFPKPLHPSIAAIAMPEAPVVLPDVRHFLRPSVGRELQHGARTQRGIQVAVHFEARRWVEPQGAIFIGIQLRIAS